MQVPFLNYLLVFAFIWQIGVCPDFCTCHHELVDLVAELGGFHESHTEESKPPEGSSWNQSHDCDGTGRPQCILKWETPGDQLRFDQVCHITQTPQDPGCSTKSLPSWASFVECNSIRTGLPAHQQSLLQVWRI